jgi:hypothetical protein
MAASVVKQSANVSAVATSTTVANLLTAAGARSMAMVVNDSGGDLFIKFGSAASSTDYSVKVAAGGYYELPIPIYGGLVTGILSTGTGTARVTAY